MQIKKLFVPALAKVNTVHIIRTEEATAVQVIVVNPFKSFQVAQFCQQLSASVHLALFVAPSFRVCTPEWLTIYIGLNQSFGQMANLLHSYINNGWFRLQEYI